MMGSGLTRCGLMFPYILVSEYFDPSTEAHLLNIWYALLGIGEAAAFFLNHLMLDKWQLSWQTVFTIWISIVTLTTLLQQMTVEEV